MNKPPQQTAAEVRDLISKTELELARLKEKLANIEAAEEEESREGRESQQHVEVNGTATTATQELNGAWKWPLSAQEYDRYGRQLILPNVGIHGALFIFCYLLILEQVRSSVDIIVTNRVLQYL